MTDLVEGKDYGKFADGTPWVRWNAIDKLRRNPPVTKKITAKIAHFIVKRLGKQISDEITKQRKEAAMSEISPETIAHVQKHRVAQVPLPLRREDAIEAIHKANASPTLSPTHYADLQKRVALANAAEIAKIKGGRVPHVELAQPDSKDDDGKDIDWSDDKIATLHYRAEKARKAQNHDGENSRPARPMTGENLNPRPLSP